MKNNFNRLIKNQNYDITDPNFVEEVNYWYEKGRESQQKYPNLDLIEILEIFEDCMKGK
jgi:hypothetical protein